MQERHVTLTPTVSFGFPTTFRGISRVVANYQHQGISCDPTVLVDYLLDDRGDIRGLMFITYRSPVFRLIYRLRCGSGLPVGNFRGGVFIKRRRIGIQFTFDDDTNVQILFYLIHRELKPRIQDRGTLWNTDILPADSY
ncbi:hypothetical protein ES703_121133 [subsurface metagenome]